MAELNSDCPGLSAFVREEFLYQGNPLRIGSFVPCYVFGVAAVPGRCLCFHVLLQNGAQIGRVPIQAITTKEGAPRLPVDELQLWDVPSEQLSVLEFDFLSGKRVAAVLKSGSQRFGRYLFTVDYWGNPTSESAGDLGWKPHHVIALDEGQLAALPNNRTCWGEGAFGVKPFILGEVPDYKVVRETWSCEDGQKWRTSEDERFFYGVES